VASAVAARDSFAEWIWSALGVPAFLYGPERSLPEVRRLAGSGSSPDVGAGRHASAGAVAVGAREVLVAYNLWLASADLELAQSIVRGLRGPSVRALALPVGDGVQVSMNLVHPLAVGPLQVYDEVALLADIERAELVGLLPASVLEAIPRERWAQLDVDTERTIESRLARRRLEPNA
jgi:glutamate formiminotransferase